LKKNSKNGLSGASPYRSNIGSENAPQQFGAQKIGSSSFDVELTDLTQLGSPSRRRAAMQAEEIFALGLGLTSS
jgi:hypothetical protein